MYSMIISLVVYAICSWYASEFLEEYLDKGIFKTMLVFFIAAFISWLVGAGIDWAFPSQAISLF